MCYQTRQIRTVKDLELRFDVGLINEAYRAQFDVPAYHLNGFAHPNMLVIPQEQPMALVPGVWGIVPSHVEPEGIKAYFKEAVKFGGGLNAQSEKLFSHFIYKQSVLRRRCIIPVTGFYEPHEQQKKKYPYYIHRADDAAFALAGLYSVIGTYITFTILTKKASPYFERIHNVRKRQPVILPQVHEADWVSADLRADDIRDIVTQAYPEEALESYPISRDLYSPKVDSNVETITNRVDYPELNTLF
jgi:putative SOS response-associated peptidase YedK